MWFCMFFASVISEQAENFKIQKDGHIFKNCFDFAEIYSFHVFRITLKISFKIFQRGEFKMTDIFSKSFDFAEIYSIVFISFTSPMPKINLKIQDSKSRV